MRRLLAALTALLALHAGANLATAQELEYQTSAYWTQAYGVKVVDQYAYCACLNGLVILDVSKPHAPALVSRLYCAGGGHDVDVWGDHAFVADDVMGLQVIDVSDPLHPSIVACYDTPGRASAVKVVDGYAYVADGAGGDCGLIILDVSKPADPRFVSQYASNGMCEKITIAGKYAYIGRIFLGLEIVNISDPHQPTLAAFYSMCSSDEICVVDDIAYVTGGCGGSRDWPDEYSILDILDVSDPTNPAALGEYIYYTGYGGGPVAIRGDHAFVRYHDPEGGEHVGAIDVSGPSQPTWAGSVAIEGGLSDLQIRDDVLYAATGSGGFKTLDVSVPSAPTVLGGWAEASSPLGIAGRDGLGFMADGLGGLRVLDLSDPLAPHTVAHLALPGSQSDVDLAGDIAYLVDFPDALNLVDIGEPSQPALLSRIVDGVRAAVVRDSYAYIAVGEPGLKIYDLSNPVLPVQVGECDLTGYAWDLEVAEGLAYVCTYHEGLQIVNVSDPMHPTLRSILSIEHEYMRALAMIDTYAYVPTNNQHVRIIDVSDPDEPRLAATFPMRCLSVISASGDRLYLDSYDTDYMSGITVLDVTDRLAPVIVDDYPLPGGCQDVLVDGPDLFVASWSSLVVLGLAAAAVDESARRLGGLSLAVSNPVSHVAGIRFVLPQAGRARVDLLDVTGRRVATLRDAFAGAGAGRMSWDWRSAGLPSGTYFVRLRANGGEASRAVTVVR